MTGYRQDLRVLLGDPGQLALEPEQLIGQMEDTIERAGYEIVAKTWSTSEAPTPTVYGPTKTIGDRELVQGVVIHRYTELARGGMLWSMMPCCPRWAHLKADAWLEFSVRCQPCGVDYGVGLISESDGGYLAAFEVTRDAMPVLSRTRSNAKPIG
ncbi:hypothetical protein SAMN05421874_12893 [Nonomuraea maritima]|uniref:Uncharacterized protein n=1 Tax=Nonomuraea maritima TaxID=683260 RepID=A0A1G9MLM5_9ACTN|nr:hypothetical protein [Nonomuraea maritima]SDL75182.1 hypothetical protein SAMN05421874_12893 [Nonomuraea maritima]